MTPLRQRMLDELRLRNYADTTVERYVDAVKVSPVIFAGARTGWARADPRV
jgi:hypothetical protein